MPKFTLDKLNKLYETGKNVDRDLFSEQRTNILLRMGDHYKKNSGKVFEELRQRGIINREKKIRLTKNHIHRITNTYENSILESSPSVKAVPFNESETHDQKSAELNQSVIDWAKTSNSWAKRQAKFIHDFINIGEVFTKIRFDPDRGPALKDEKGEVVGNVGEFVIERVLGFDMKRNPEARSIEEVKWWIHDQMIMFDDFKKLVGKLKPEIKDEVSTSHCKTMKIFDASTGRYRDVNNQVLVKELFYKPDAIHPNGRYVMFTEEHVISDDELPFGIYPIVASGFDEMTTSPRSSSIIRVCRPYQVEINRAASKMAEHQITLGDDKVYIQKGTKLSNGGYLHGVRAFQVSGKEPIIQPGRSGAQYLEYQLSQIREMYEASNLEFLLQDKQVVGDPYQLLFRAMKDKKRFVKYAEKYQQWEIDVFKPVLRMAKEYLEPGHIIRAAGRSEIINIEEFKRMDENGFEIKVVPQTGDVESQFGKILSITQTLQYAGGQLKPEQIGNLIKHLPFANESRIFESLTVDSDNAENVILALDRGQAVPVAPMEDHQFMMKALDHRMKKADFRFMDERIQLLYFQRMQEHQAIFAQQQLAIQQAQAGFIPTDGFLVTVNASWPNPATNRVERLKIPSGALEWLVSKLQQQGTFVQEVSELPENVQSEIAQLPQIFGQSQIDQPIINGAASPELGE
jgi:hypothetical protein